MFTCYTNSNDAKKLISFDQFMAALFFKCRSIHAEVPVLTIFPDVLQKGIIEGTQIPIEARLKKLFNEMRMNLTSCMGSEYQESFMMRM
ncbi:hypothetical protein AC629_42800 [Bradyrhizobium sp. NAS80.1]|nr:hypothetical protein AC629_42800 [Bradyrhizobium sp. NAS80.1]